MAVLNATDLADLRGVAQRNLVVHYTKTQVNAALQAIEDRMQLASTKTALGNDIEAAAPGVFTAAEKTTLFGIWCWTAAKRLGIN
jgi:hypothetical protein